MPRYRVEPDFDKSQVVDDESGVIEVWAMRDLAEQSAGRLNRIDELQAALEQIAKNGGVGPYEPPHEGHKPDPWYNALVRCGEIARAALQGNEAT